MITAIEYALMAGHAYRTTRDEINWIPAPQGWTPFFPVPDPSTPFFPATAGFEAISFTNGTEIVISFAGTGGDGDWANNILLITGYQSAQLRQAADYYLQVKALNPTANITFTGHSLGGGLASLMAVFFDETAYTFDQAPFRASAKGSLITDSNGFNITRSAAQDLRTYLNGSVPDTMLARLDAYIVALDVFNNNPIAADTLAAREAKVTNLNVQGEVLSVAPATLFDRIGIQAGANSLANNGDILLMIDLHSQALLTAFLQSGDLPTSTATDHTLGQVTFKLPDLLKMIFDPKLYYNEPNNLSSNAPENFLERLVKHQAGNVGVIPVGGDAMVTRFTSDLWKLAQDGGLTMNDNNTSNAQLNEVSKALTAFAMQMYYEDTANATNSSKQLFTKITGGIQFDLADVSKDISAAFEAKTDVDLTKAKGYELYFSKYLMQVNAGLTEEESNLIKAMLPTLRDWYVQAGAGGMTATDTLNRNAFMLGGRGSDTLVGGSGRDFLVGNVGDDTLTGGKGSDVLLGGTGLDTYLYTTGDGSDLILDSDNNGIIKIDNQTMMGGAQYGDNRVYKSTDANGIKYTYVYVTGNASIGGDLLINNSILIKNYNPTSGNRMGLSFNPAAAEITPQTTPLAFSVALGNLVINDTNGVVNHTVYVDDTTGNDYILADDNKNFIYALQGGDNIIEARGGRDFVEAGAGRDVILGGDGGDILYGGAGDDRIYADAQMTVEQAILNGNSNANIAAQGDVLVGGTGDDILVGSASNDVLLGGGGQDLLIGGAGNDTISGDLILAGPANFDWTVIENPNYTRTLILGSVEKAADGAADVIYAGKGNDFAVGGLGNDIIFGEEGDDILHGDDFGIQAGSDYLDGGAGEDVLIGDGGDDVLVGGKDNDILYGGAGNDTYIYNVGDGIDTLYDDFTTPGANTLRFGVGVNKDNIKLRKGSLLLDLGGGDQIHIEGFNTQDVFNSVGIGRFEFADGTSLSSNELLARGFDLDGTANNDTITGTNTTDRITGFGGADRLLGYAGTDTLNGGDGNDELQGGDDADTLFGGTGDDQLIGGNGNDILNGEDGNDELQGDDGVDTLNGGLGDDRLYGQAGDDVLNGDAGIDELQGGDGNDTLMGGAGNDILYGQNNNDTLDGGAGDDILSGDLGVDTYVFGRGYGRDSIYDFDGGTTGSGILQFNADVNAADVQATRQGGDLVLAISGTDDALTIKNYYVPTSSTPQYYYGEISDYTYTYGYQLAQIKFADGTAWTPATISLFSAGTSGTENLYGTGNNDTFASSTGNDFVSGGAGSDTYYFGVGSGKDTVYDTVGLSADVNKLLLSAAIAPVDVKVSRIGNNLILALNNAPDEVTLVNYFREARASIEQIIFTGNATVWNRQAIDQILLTATEQDDTLFGTPAAETLNGLGGNDSITGDAGNDTLDGGSGNDTLLGGMGDDSYLFGRGAGSDTISGEDINSGVLDKIVLAMDVLPSDVVLTRVNDDLILTITGTPDQLRVGGYFTDFRSGAIGTVEQIQFLADNTVWDTAIIRSMLPQATELNDTLYGYEGNDVLNGLGGNDTLLGGRGDDTYVFNVGSGFDMIIDHGMNGIRENVLRLGAGFTPDNIIVTRSGDDMILFRPDGTDQLTIQSQYRNGVSGVNQVIFDDGTVWDINKLWSFGGVASNGADILKGTLLDDSLYGYGGNDTIYGYSGNDTLDGGTGDDWLVGGKGNDIYLVDSTADTITENLNEGIDSVQSMANYTLSDNIENLTLVKDPAFIFAQNINGTGNALDNILVGNRAKNVLSGGAGNDTLDGGDGADTLNGGFGDDTYIIDSLSYSAVTGTDVPDAINENVNEGVDTVRSSLTYVLGANLENLTLTGSGNINGSGNALVNILLGNAGNNVLDGGAGADTMQGGAGDDSYIVDNVGDSVMESANEGVDSVQSAVAYVLSSNIENLTLTGSTAINGTGNSLNNVLTGNSAVNALTGGGGDDTYIIGTGDSVVENANEGIDTVQSAATYTLGSNLENLILIGTGTINGTGNAFNNVIIGNTANNTLTGGAGDDRLDGGGGTDKLIGGTGNDYYVIDSSRDAITELANEGIDTVQTTFTYTLASNLENLKLAEGFLINGTGNAFNNVITGNALDNILNGVAGTDTMIGGAGNDTFVIDNIGDVVVENTGEGTDNVQSLVSYTLSANVENLVLTGTAAINGTGNSLNNVLTGNSAANILTGGGGDDTYVVGAGDTIVENANEGADTIQTGVAYTLGANFENLTLTGTSVINGTGNNLNNILSGSGNTKANVLTAGLGDDTYIVGSGDTAVEYANEGIDTVLSSLSFTLGANLENLTLTGTSAINGTGNASNNVLTGNGAANVLTGGAGDDTYIVSTGDTVMETANQGIDTVQSDVNFTLGANVENLILTGAAAINASGNTLNNVLTGNAGNNLLDGGAGADRMIGGLGDDIYVVDNVADIVVENVGDGNDTVQSYISFTSGGNVENVTLMGTDVINATGDAGNNILTGNSAANILTGGLGDDTYVVGAGDTIVEYANEGVDTVESSSIYTLDANVENLNLTGTAAINGTGNSLNNVITGNAGNNVLDGGDGVDILYGGDGNDTLIGSAGDMLYGGAGDDIYNITVGASINELAGAGVDTIVSEGSISLLDYANIENVTLTGIYNNQSIRGSDSNNVLIGSTTNDVIQGWGGDDRLEGGAGNDNLDGMYGSDYLDGGAGDDWLDGGESGLDNWSDTLLGGDGNDTLIGNGNASIGLIDTLKGGAGDDYYYARGDAVLVENSNEGNDTVDSGNSTYTLGANFENLKLYSAATGTGNALNNFITVTSNLYSGVKYSNTLYGLGGDDTLDGGDGADTLVGGTGNDTYIVDTTSDVITENLNEGSDTVKSSITYTLTAANVENLTLTGAAEINATGNNLNNVLTGNSAANVLTGGLGNDTYVIDSLDTIVENTNEGTDTIQTANSYTLSNANIENLTLTGTSAVNGTGNAGNNVLTGNAGNNILDGLVGADNMSGGLGNDTYVVDNSGDVVVETLGEGTDSILASVSYILSANVENLTLTGVATINGTGNALNNVLVGNSAANTLSGGLGDDTYVITDALDTLLENANEGIDTVQSSASYTLGANLENLTLTGNTVIGGTGNALNNVLKGNGAGSTLRGGFGDDTYLFDNNDSVIENANEGIDTVLSTASYTLGANIENLILTGFTAISGTGNELNNTLTGNDNGNTLNGGAGADTMLGGRGNDTYIVDNAADAIIENMNEGTDSVQSSLSYTLASNIENLTLTGTAAINGTGNALNNVLTGNSGNNVLTGGLGDDTYVFGSGDTVIENANEGTDTVQSSVSYTLLANVENLTLTGSTAINGTGNELNNVLAGNSAANILSGGLGDDTYVVSDTLDTIIENVNEGNDTVQSLVTYTLGANLENLTLTGSVAINGTGNSLNNILTGNSGSNVLTGGLGDDTYVIGSGDTVIENVGEGIDTVLASLSYTLGSTLENLTLTGNTAINGYGNGLDNVLLGNSAGNTLDGQTGADTMSGGAGNDTYFVDVTGDVVTENVGEGVDTVYSAVDFVLGDNLENLNMSYGLGVNGTGNALNNSLVGSIADNVLMGLAGDDKLDGGIGADTLIGGIGNDIYVVDNIGDVVVENAGDGVDTVQSTISYALGNDLENLTLLSFAAVNGTGNALNNILLGSSASNMLDGGAGADAMSGGNGDDTYVVDNAGDTVNENTNEGTDTVLSSVTFTLGANVENLTLTGTDAINGTGNNLNNVLIGNSAANTLTGGVGSDWLDGGAGADILIGGDGNDAYVVDDIGDDVQETLLYGGVDRVLSSVSFTLGENIEDLTLTGANVINASGNGLDNVLIGNNAANTIDGKAGADTMIGGQGDDTYVVDNINDWVGEYANEGIDTVQSIISHTLASNVENLILTGTAAINGTDNSLNNLLTGNTANNVLTAGTGNDILQGGAGNDILSDTAGSNLLDGGQGADIMTGGAGNEFFAGGAGNDTITTGTGADIIAFNRGDGQDILNGGVGTDNTLSLGGGILYSDLALSRVGNDLILEVGSSEQITLRNWYDTTANYKSVLNLQMVADAMASFDPASTDPLLDQAIQNFDFTAIVNSFDMSGAPSNWSAMDSLLTAHLSASDTTALGGDLAYQYGKAGSFTGMNLAAAQTVMNDPQFGATAQALRPLQGLQGGSVTL